MRRDQKTRLDKIAAHRGKGVSAMTNAELDEIIRAGVEADGGTEASAAKRRANGEEDRALFIEAYMAGRLTT